MVAFGSGQDCTSEPGLPSHTSKQGRQLEEGIRAAGLWSIHSLYWRDVLWEQKRKQVTWSYLLVN